VLAGDTDEHRDAVFSEGGRLGNEMHCSEQEAPGATDPTNIYWPRVNLQTSDGPEHTKAVMCRTRDFKYVRRLDESDELYDLRTDPDELHNRIADPALAGVLAQLKDRLLTFYVETSDVVPIKGKGFAET
jgi:arylsulfatase A-like enzyme